MGALDPVAGAGTFFQFLVRHYPLADGPERNHRQLQVRPGERYADDRQGERHGRQQMAQGQPPAG